MLQGLLCEPLNATVSVVCGRILPDQLAGLPQALEVVPSQSLVEPVLKLQLVLLPEFTELVAVTWVVAVESSTST